MASRKRERFAIYDAVTGRMCVAATFLTEQDAESHKQELMKKPEDLPGLLGQLMSHHERAQELHARLAVHTSKGCQHKCVSRGLVCNLMPGHEGPHQEVIRKSPTRVVVHTFPGVH